jgi:hypothetical protein
VKKAASGVDVCTARDATFRKLVFSYTQFFSPTSSCTRGTEPPSANDDRSSSSTCPRARYRCSDSGVVSYVSPHRSFLVIRLLLEMPIPSTFPVESPLYQFRHCESRRKPSNDMRRCHDSTTREIRSQHTVCPAGWESQLHIQCTTMKCRHARHGRADLEIPLTFSTIAWTIHTCMHSSSDRNICRVSGRMRVRRHQLTSQRPPIRSTCFIRL